ncbi:hypothetical protein [Microbacterium sp. bgisy189]|uniref:hypothetical protein n=1 Tax=Microbacterium sp. bgisy189 TaxID=3413798 RepID=UPI003EBA137E
MGFWNAPDGRPLSGENGFRLMPTDDLATLPASGRVDAVAGGHGIVLTYAWQHPVDGSQTGALLVGSPDEDGVITASWLDSWHQQPSPMTLVGTPLADGGCALAATYAGDWGWQIDVTVDGGVRLVMRNVVPASAIGPDTPGEAGAYDVMVMRLV